MTIPMCWKCASKIISDHPEDMGQLLIGCKENPNIHSYGSACVLCPLIQPKGEKHDSDVCEGQRD